ncbi:hypothetical protein [Paenibacillus sp. GP183]|uniref:5' nucleotidase, NT5C type n=1 Tax=Paenibacillus sp. GP183 TaxID=1882751 RepID=UPI0008956D87|nr:hypothetical protein [Paenibacillus sp. GP183]SEC04117.1 Uncharacterized protein, HAD superfamily [Paenibacillus sp. GP183]
MHIGIDLDNTVLDATTAFLDCFNKVTGLSVRADDVNDFYLYRLYGWDKEQYENVYYLYGHEIHWNSNPYPMAIEIIQNLFIENQISVITARPSIFRDITIEWLKHNDIPYHNIIFTENKIHECEKSSVNVLIDDGPHYAMEFALKQKPVILFQQPYNMNIHNKMVYRISHWSEVKKYIDLLSTLKNHP